MRIPAGSCDVTQLSAAPSSIRSLTMIAATAPARWHARVLELKKHEPRTTTHMLPRTSSGLMRSPQASRSKFPGLSATPWNKTTSPLLEDSEEGASAAADAFTLKNRPGYFLTSPRR